MKKIFSSSGLAFVLILVFANIGLFMSGTYLSEKVNDFEPQIKLLTRQNIDLEKKVVEISSLGFTASEAAKLGFVQKANPISLNKLGIAKLRQVHE